MKVLLIYYNVLSNALGIFVSIWTFQICQSSHNTRHLTNEQEYNKTSSEIQLPDV